MDGEIDDPELLSNAAGEIYRMRRARDRYLPKELTGEPAWDILLALYAEEPAKLPVSSLCFGRALRKRRHCGGSRCSKRAASLCGPSIRVIQASCCSLLRNREDFLSNAALEPCYAPRGRNAPAASSRTSSDAQPGVQEVQPSSSADLCEQHVRRGWQTEIRSSREMPAPFCETRSASTSVISVPVSTLNIVMCEKCASRSSLAFSRA